MSYTNGLDKPSDYFNTVLYTGDGTTSNSITGVGFQPDWIWIKKRNSTASHRLLDSIRGVQKHLASDNTDAEVTQNSVMSFDTDGFTVGNSAGTNGSSDTFASWNWYTGATASSNTDGSITSSVSANTTAGFSIVSYTGTGSAATVGHGLGVKPNMIITKRRNGTVNWMVYHSTLGATKYVQVDTTGSAQTSSTRWNNTEPTSSVFTVGTSSGTNPSSGTMIGYCFAEKKGYSKFGSYTGNGNADGTFVYTGFKPAWIMFKRTNTTGSWVLLDNKRSTINVVDDYLLANSTNAEAVDSTVDVDFVSNGFKFRNTSQNESGNTLIYMAFAENPFVTSTGIPTTAR